MKEILVAGFKGENNSSKILLDKINNNDKLYLENDFKISEEQLSKTIKQKKYDEVIIFGQKPLIKKIYIELKAKRKTEVLKTNYDYNKIMELLNKNDYKTIISNDAGNYLCNNIYFYALKIFNHQQILFVHIPTLKNIKDVETLAKIFSEFLKIRYIKN